MRFSQAAHLALHRCAVLAFRDNQFTFSDMPISLPVHVRARSLTGFDQLVSSHGGSVAALLAWVGLDPELLRRPDATLSFAQAAALLDHSAEMLDLPDIGLRLAAYQDISVLGPLALVVRHAANVREAVDGVARHLPYNMPGARLNLHVDAANDSAELRYELRGDDGAPSCQVVELSYANACKFLRLLTQHDGAGWRVSFRHSQALSPARYRKAFGCVVTFDQPHDALSFPSRLLDVAIDPANAELRRNAERYVRNVVRRFPLDIGSQTAALAERQLGAGSCSLVLVARELGLHERTLQRRLSEQGLHFEDIVDRLRRERASEYLPYSAISLAQVAALLGYSDQTAFTRACRRWFGESPRKLRRAL